MGVWLRKCTLCGIKMARSRGQFAPITGKFTCYECSSRFAAEKRRSKVLTGPQVGQAPLQRPASTAQQASSASGSGERVFAATGDAVWTAVYDYANTHEMRECDLPAGRLVFTTTASLSSPGEKYVVTVTGTDGHMRVSVKGSRKRAMYAEQPGRVNKIRRALFASVSQAVGGPDESAPPWKR